MTSFVKDCITKLLAGHGDLKDICIVLPSVRAGVVVREELTAQLKDKNTFLPQILGIEQLIEEMAGIKTLPEAQLLLEFYSVYLDQARLLDLDSKDSFWEFLGWGSLLIGDFNELDRYLVDPASFFSYFSAVKEMNHWSQKADSKMTRDYLNFWKSLEHFHLKINKRLIKKGVGYQGMLYRLASANAESYLKKRNREKYIFIGFNALNSAEQQIFQLFKEKGRAEILWDIDKFFAEDRKSSTSFFIREYFNRWSIYRDKRIQPSSESFNSEKDILVAGVSQQVGQAKYVGQILADMTLEERAKTAIVLGDENLLLPLLNSLPKDVGPLNVTMGLPLRLIPDAGFFEVLLRLYGNFDRAKYSYKDLQELFSHAFAQVLFKSDCNRILNLSIHSNSMFLSSAEIKSVGKERTTDDVFGSESPDVHQFIQLVLRLLKILEAHFKNEESWLELEYVYRFTTLFQQLEGLQLGFGHIDSLKSLKSFYEILLTQETLDFRGDPYKGLQIMGVLESRVLDFENVIITSLNEGVLPSGKSQGSNIPFDVKLNFNLPTYREKDAVYSYHFFRLLQRAKKAYLLYNNEPGSMDSAEKSRFLLQLHAIKKSNFRLEEITVTAPIHFQRETLSRIEKDQQVIDKLKVQAEKGFSPSALLLYILNPIAFYQRYVLDIQEVESVEETVAFNTLGTIVHKTLENLFKPHLNQILTTDVINGMQQKAPDEITQQFAKNYNLKNVKQGKNLIIFNVAAQFVKNFLSSEEKSLAAGNEMIVKDLERDSHITLSGFDFPVVLRGNIDRIDQYNGTTRVVDYKTGKVETYAMNLKDRDLVFTDYKKGSKVFQVLCYALVLHRSGIAQVPLQAGIISFKNLKSGFMPFKADRDPEISVEILDVFEEKLKTLISEILDINVPFVEKETPFD